MRSWEENNAAPDIRDQKAAWKGRVSCEAGKKDGDVSETTW